MFSEREAKAEILVAMAAVDAVRQRIDDLKEAKGHWTTATEMAAALDEAEGIRETADAAFHRTLDLLCGGLPTMALKLDVAQDLRRAAEQRHRADHAAAAAAQRLMEAAGVVADDALSTRRPAEIETAIRFLDRARTAFAAVAARKIDGLIKMPKFWASACAEEIAALRALEVREAA